MSSCSHTECLIIIPSSSSSLVSVRIENCSAAVHNLCNLQSNRKLLKMSHKLFLTFVMLFTFLLQYLKMFVWIRGLVYTNIVELFFFFFCSFTMCAYLFCKASINSTCRWTVTANESFLLQWSFVIDSTWKDYYYFQISSSPSLHQ